MVQIFIGIIAFLLFFMGDYNDWKLSCPVFRLCFPIGFVLLVMATATGFFTGDGIRNILLVIPAAVFLFLLVYTLFLALPAKEAYVSQEEGRKVCSTGVYALCRHPGVLWFLGLYVCLYFMGVVNIGSLIVFNSMNVLLVVFEDRYVFPANMAGYEEYKRSVPFLIPGTKAIIKHYRSIITEN